LESSLNLSYKKFSNLIDPDKCYDEAEKKAFEYFKELSNLVFKKESYGELSDDISEWSLNHKTYIPLLDKIFENKKNKMQYGSYIKWLKRLKKLDKYLKRSVSYIYMRDLGKFLGDSETIEKIDKIVDNLKSDLDLLDNSNENMFSYQSLYKRAKKEKIENSVIWLMEKIKRISKELPKELDPSNAKRKLIKLIAGVLMHSLEDIKKDIKPDLRTKKLDKAIKLGYSYGITYPFIDDILDANILNQKEKRQYSEIIRITLLTGNVPDYRIWKWKNSKLIFFILNELKEAFDYIKSFHDDKSLNSFFSQAFIFYNSQEIDRVKDLNNNSYTNEEIYIPIILKSSSSRQIVKIFTEDSIDEEFNKYMFYYGIYNQLADDFTDMFLDLEEESVTPYTYYIKYHEEREDLINPFELYWNVIYYLTHNIYINDYMTKEVIFSRAFNSLRRFKEKLGTKKYNEIMRIISPKDNKFNTLLSSTLNNIYDVDFLDKLLRDNINLNLSEDENKINKFQNEMKVISKEIEKNLNFKLNTEESEINDVITKAANYSLNSGGKHLRSLIAWMIGVKGYKLNIESIMPILCALEYMHTASLIFDDLPSQDNSDTRRGNKTLHKVYGVAVSELTGIFLTQKSVYAQSTLKKFNNEDILQMIKYTSDITAKMCKGQLMDLDAKGKNLSVSELKLMSYYKTGLAFEASLLMPSIIAEASRDTILILKDFAKFLGIVFQIKDDILDFEGNHNEMGKPSKIDIKNGSSTFVSELGLNEAKKEMWDNYSLAIDELNKLNFDTEYLKLTLDYILTRNK
jgi:geranylgeranyl pyrophosphate synthase